MASKVTFFLLMLFAASCFQPIMAYNNLTNELLDAADKRDSSLTVFDRALSGNSMDDQKQALLALGRIGDKNAVLKILPFLHSKQPNVRTMAAFALGITNDYQAHKALQILLKNEQHSVVLSQALSAIGTIGEPTSSIATILPFLNHKNDNVIAAACDGLTLAWSFHRDRVSIPNSTQFHRLLELSTKNEILAEHCLYTLARLRQETKLFDIQQLITVYKGLTSAKTKMLALRIMGALQQNELSPFFIQAIHPDNPVNIRAEGASAIALLQYQEQLLPTIKQLTNDSSSLVKVNLIDNLQLSKENKPLLAVAEILLNDKSQWVRHRAILALFAVKGTEMGEHFLSLLNAKDFQSQQLALQIIRDYKLPEQNKFIKVLANSEHKGIKSIASRLLTNEDPDSEVFGEASKSVSAAQAVAIAGKQLNIKTSRGQITIQLLTSAPFTSTKIYELAMSGFYDGLIFHRVVPNFVVQGGDPESTGQGGPGFSIREELYPTVHKRGTVGIATSGKDTGGSQLFFNNADNLHLSNHYTIFARVIKGIELIDTLEVGDQIISITEVP